MDLLTKRQLACLAELPEDHRMIGVRRGSPIIERADGEILRIQPNGRLAVTTSAAITSVEQVRSYLEMERC